MYREAGDQAHVFLRARGFPTDPTRIEKRHVENWLIYLREERNAKPATIAARFSALRRFFTWLEAEKEIELSPMVRMKTPAADVLAPEVLTPDEHRRLLDACRGGDFEDKRDLAIPAPDDGQRLAAR
jgi:site-specific recombinase XerD